MGSSFKTLTSLMSLTNTGALPPESDICDIGATQLFGANALEGAKSFLSFYASRTTKATPPEDVPAERLLAIANNGFLGDLLLLAGFKYTALDIFHGVNTVLFDLNVHAPGPKLAGRFDLVMNFGTTEHVFNQYRAFQTIHDLTKVGGVIYHDLPMAGYFDHALFRYDPLFFRTVLPANSYELLEQKVSMGASRKVPQSLRKIGYDHDQYVDVGIEVIVRRKSGDPFKIPMEASTALSIDPEFENVSASDYVAIPSTSQVIYGVGMAIKAGDLDVVPGRELLAALIARIRQRFGV